MKAIIPGFKYSFILCMLTILGLITNIAQCYSQTRYRLSPTGDNSVIITGTSAIDDWSMKSATMESSGTFELQKGKLLSVNAISFSLQSKSLKSGNPIMEAGAYKALNADRYPAITYKHNSAVLKQLEVNNYLIQASGELTINGVTRKIKINITAIVKENKFIVCKGSEKLKLSDYTITAPQVGLGALKVSDNIEMNFTLVYQ